MQNVTNVLYDVQVNTVLALAGLKQAKQDDPERRSLRISASLLPMFSVIWFLGVVALEHSSSLVLPLLFVATSGFLVNIFVKGNILYVHLPKQCSIKLCIKYTTNF